MSGLALIFVFVVAVAALILLISKLNLHPFLAIMLVSLAFGLIAGLPLIDVKEGGEVVDKGVVTVIGSGFSKTFQSIGLVIIFGALIGAILEVTGGALKLADIMVRLVGKKRPELAVELMGWIVSIPVYCDSGFVILNPIRKSIARRTGVSSVRLTVALACGLYISHVFIPPTPGPIAAADTLGIGDDLIIVIGMGLLASICPLVAGYFFSRWAGSRVKSRDEIDSDEIEQSYEELVASFGKLPNGFATFAPIIVPIVLMALGSISAILGWEGLARQLCGFFGAPVIALGVGVVLAFTLMASSGMRSKFRDVTEETLKTVGPILFITAAGGALGTVIGASDIVPFITDNAELLSSFGIVFPFLLSAVLKTAQGSSTVALTTTAGILAPLMGSLGFDTPAGIAVAVMAIGAGAMTVSHANDSYFWVVTNFGEMSPEQGYQTQTLATLVLGLSSMVGITAMWLIFV